MNRISGVLRTGFIALLEKHLSDRMKRLVMLASFSGRLKGEVFFEQETLSKLNEVMALSNREPALLLPVLLNKAIWKGQSAVQITGDPAALAPQPLDEAHVRNIVTRVLAAAPSWLRYDEESVMRKDLAKLLGNRHMLLRA